MFPNLLLLDQDQSHPNQFLSLYSTIFPHKRQNDVVYIGNPITLRETLFPWLCCAREREPYYLENDLCTCHGILLRDFLLMYATNKAQTYFYIGLKGDPV